MKHLFTNWKTTVAGLLTAGIAIATAFNWITVTQATEITSVLVSLGLMAAKDSNIKQ